MDRLTKEQRICNMSSNKSKGTKPELLFGKLLWNYGIRYRKNDKRIYGKPDFVIHRLKIAIFCDGDFWHGKDWDIRKHDHKSNIEYWHKKIERNIERDIEVNKLLTSQGWKVFRFWETDIVKTPEKCIKTILDFMNKKIAKKEPLSITKLYDNKKIALQIYGPNSLNDDDTIIPFDEQLAIISHYLHNYSFKFAKPFEKKASGLIEDIYNYGKKEIVTLTVFESNEQLSLFPDLYNVPFVNNEIPRFTFIDLFAGIGGFRMAMQNLGGKCVFSSEWDTQAKKTYLLNYGEVPFGDITKESTKSYIPDGFDILCAGFPCQAFSLAGK